MRMEGDPPILFQALRNPRILLYFSRKISALIENLIRSFSSDGRDVTGFFAFVRGVCFPRRAAAAGGFVELVCSH